MIGLETNNILKNSIITGINILTSGTNRTEFKFDKALTIYCNSIVNYLNEKIELPNFKSIEKIFFAKMYAEMENTNNNA